MKKILTFLTVALALACQAQTNWSFVISGGGTPAAIGNYIWTGTNVNALTGSAWDGYSLSGTNLTSYFVYINTNAPSAPTLELILVSGITYDLYTTNLSSPIVPGTTYTLASIGAGAPPAPTLTINLGVPAPITIASSTLNNFWPTNGGRVSFQASGWNNSVSGASVIVQLGGSTVFTSGLTAGRGRKLSLSGTLDFDGTTNMIANVAYAGGDTNNPFVHATTTLTNFNQTNVTFSIALDSSSDTNLVLTSGSIQAQFGQAFTLLVPLPPLTLPLITIPSNTASTLGQGAGQFCGDSNYLYLSVGTNLWKRVAVTNW